MPSLRAASDFRFHFPLLWSNRTMQKSSSSFSFEIALKPTLNSDPQKAYIPISTFNIFGKKKGLGYRGCLLFDSSLFAQFRPSIGFGQESKVKGQDTKMPRPSITFA
jgi:hypothetical protein